MGCVHRWVHDHGATRLLVMESSGHIEIPSRFLSPQGQFLEHAPYSGPDFHGPTEPLLADDGEAECW